MTNLKTWLNSPLNDLVEVGSFTNKEDLKRLTKALNRRIHRMKAQLNNKLYDKEKLSNDIYKASIYRDEFKKLERQL